MVMQAYLSWVGLLLEGYYAKLPVNLYGLLYSLY